MVSTRIRRRVETGATMEVFSRAGGVRKTADLCHQRGGPAGAQPELPQPVNAAERAQAQWRGGRRTARKRAGRPAGLTRRRRLSHAPRPSEPASARGPGAAPTSGPARGGERPLPLSFVIAALTAPDPTRS